MHGEAFFMATLLSSPFFMATLLSSRSYRKR
jgi:hypothetical protein